MPSSEALCASAGPATRSPIARRLRVRRAQRAVDVDEAVVVELDARLVEPEALDVGRAAGGDHEPVDLARLAAVLEGARSVVGRLDVLDERRRVDLDALLLEAALGELGDVGVLGRQDAVEAPRRAGPRRRGARTRWRSRCPTRRRRRRPSWRAARSSAHASSVPMTRPPNSRARDRLLHRAGGEDDRLGASISCPSKLPPTLTLPSAVSDAVALDDVDAVLLEQAGDAAGQRLDDLLAARRITAPKSTVGSATWMPNSPASRISLQHVGRAQHRLGGDAGVVQAAPADLVALDHGGLHAELRGADRGHVAARARADDDDVVGGFGHGTSTLANGSVARGPRAGSLDASPSTRTSFQNSHPPRPTTVTQTTTASDVRGDEERQRGDRRS